MATRTTARTRASSKLEKPDLLDIYRIMVLARRIDDKEIQLKRQNRIFFQISGAGHEAVLAAAAQGVPPHLRLVLHLLSRSRPLPRPRHDGHRAAPLGGRRRRTTPTRAAGRCRRTGATSELNIVSASSPTGTQFLQAVGCAEAWLRYPHASRASPTATSAIRGDEVVLCTTGDGTTSEGEFWEALNTASNLKLPVRVPGRGQRLRHLGPGRGEHPGRLDLQAGDRLSRSLHSGGGRLRRHGVLRRPHQGGGLRPRAEGPGAGPRPGHPPLQPLAVRRRGAVPADRRSGRPMPSGIPSRRFPALPAGAGHRDAGGARAVVHAGRGGGPGRGRRRRSRRRSRAPTRSTSTSTRPTSIPTSEQFDTEDDPRFTGEPTTMVDLLNACLRDEMARDPRILVFGEDVADVQPGGAPRRGEGEGRRVQGDLGPAAAVRRRPGLQLTARRGQHRRPRDRPRHPGPQAGGRDPVLRLHLARLHAAPQRARDSALALATTPSPRRSWCGSPTAATSRAASVYHSQTGAAVFTGVPGLRVVCPATALDANGLLRTAIRCDDPVLFLEHKHLYRQTYNKAPNPGPNFMIPLREGQGGAAGHRSHRRHLRRRWCSASIWAAKEARGDARGRASR